MKEFSDFYINGEEGEDINLALTEYFMQLITQYYIRRLPLKELFI